MHSGGSKVVADKDVSEVGSARITLWCDRERSEAAAKLQ